MIATRLHDFLFPSSSVHILGNHPHKRTNQMTHKHISKIGMGRQKSKRLFFHFTKFHSSSTPFTVWIVMVWWWVCSFPSGRAGQHHQQTKSIDYHIANEKTNKQTTGVPGVVSEIKEQSVSVKEVTPGQIVCVSLSRWKHKQMIKRKWLTPKKKKKRKANF